jgi:hypothetical protein
MHMLGMDTTPHQNVKRPASFGRRHVMAIGLLVLVAMALTTGAYASTDASWDPQRYIDVNEVKPGMEAYCLTDYGDNGIEKFELKVLDVVYEMDPGHDAILVMGMDERFKHSGPVGGCSGSPVYIDGRLAGALAFGWSFAKDPLYGVTPIREMLAVGKTNTALTGKGAKRQAAFAFDFSKPIDLSQVSEQVLNRRLIGPANPNGASALPCPLLISGIPTPACQELASQFDAMGFMAVPGLTGTATNGDDESMELKVGGTLTLPLVTGDINMNVLGTVTEIRGDRVYAFGHSFLGYGGTDLPMAGGKVYTVISNVMRSFKLGTSGKIAGSITTDEVTAVSGRIGAEPNMVPMSIRVDRYNDTEPRRYNCRIAYNDTMTAALARSAIAAAALQLGPLPPEHTIEYSAAIEMDDGQSIRFDNISASMGLIEPVSEIVGTVALLMNNPFRCAKIKSMDFATRIRTDSISSHFWSVDVVDPQIKAGEEIEANVVIESYLGEKKKYKIKLTVPKNVAAGKYGLMLCGAQEYERFLAKTVPYRFIATNYQTLVEALNVALNIDRTKLYCVLVLPPEGITLDKAELPDLPGTKSVILQSDTRALRVQPYPHWIEKTIETGTVIGDKEIVPIVVEE